MKTIIIAMLWTVIVSVRADDEGVFVSNAGERVMVTIEDGQMVLRSPATKLSITHVILRNDTEDRKTLWLEIHMKKPLDPGDYSCRINLKHPQPDSQPYLRASKIHRDGCKWSFKFTSIEAARKVLDYVKKSHALSSSNTKDQTKG